MNPESVYYKLVVDYAAKIREALNNLHDRDVVLDVIDDILRPIYEECLRTELIDKSYADDISRGMRAYDYILYACLASTKDGHIDTFHALCNDTIYLTHLNDKDDTLDRCRRWLDRHSKYSLRPEAVYAMHKAVESVILSSRLQSSKKTDGLAAALPPKDQTSKETDGLTVALPSEIQVDKELDRLVNAMAHATRVPSNNDDDTWIHNNAIYYAFLIDVIKANLHAADEINEWINTLLSPTYDGLRKMILVDKDDLDTRGMTRYDHILYAALT